MSGVKFFSGGIHVNVHEDLDDKLNRRNQNPHSSYVQRPHLRNDNISARGVKNVNQSNTDSVKHGGSKVDPLETFQKVLWTNSRDTSMSVGSQASSVDSSQTFDSSRTNQLNQSSNPPHSFPMTSSCTGARLKTGSLDSSQVHSIFPKSVKKGTPIRSDDSKLSDLELKRSDNLASPVSRSDDLKSSVSSSVSGSSRRSQVSQNSKRSAKSYRSQHPNASFSEDEINDDIEGPGENMELLVPNNSKHTSINADIVSDEEDGEVDEKSKLLPVRGASMNDLEDWVGVLRNKMAQSQDAYSSECDRKLSSNSGDGEVSVKEPVEHDDLNCGDTDMRNPTGKELQCSPFIIVSPGKQGWHKGIMTLVAAASLSEASHFWFSIDNSWRVASISCKLYRRVKHHKIQVKFDKGVWGNLQNFD